jgi:hypothetical protein
MTNADAPQFASMLKFALFALIGLLALVFSSRPIASFAEKGAQIHASLVLAGLFTPA